MLRRVVSVSVIVSDRSAGYPNVASFGDDDNPGCDGLIDLAIRTLAGVHALGEQSCRFVPLSDAPMQASVDGGSPRAAWVAEFSVEQGWQTTFEE